MGNVSKSNIEMEEGRLEGVVAGQAFLRVAILTLIAVVAAALVLAAILLVIT